MKNSEALTAYLDCEERIRQGDPGEDRLRLYYACLTAGWTAAEVDAAYERRFGLEPGAIARMRYGKEAQP